MLSMTGCGVAMWYAELGACHRNNIMAATDNYGEALKQRLKQRLPLWFTFLPRDVAASFNAVIRKIECKTIP
jgi:hypothetical protein